MKMPNLFLERPTRPIDRIIVHCSDLEQGDRMTIYKIHVTEMGWSDIGYHFIILNSMPNFQKDPPFIPNPEFDGKIVLGRDINKMGAHCKGNNKGSIGICLMGKELFTGRQIYSLLSLISRIKEMYPDIKLSGHYEMPSGKAQGKTCPNIDMNWLRKECGIKNEET